MTKTISISYGDKSGPEIMESTLEILKYANAKINFDIVEIGQNIYEKGFNSGLMPSIWDHLQNSKILLKAPIFIPKKSNYQNHNLALQNKLGLFANIKKIRSLYQENNCNNPNLDLVIIKEVAAMCKNQSQFYKGSNYLQTSTTFLKENYQKIINYAFKYALQNNRKKITLISNDYFDEIFSEIATNYPEITTKIITLNQAIIKISNSTQDFDILLSNNLNAGLIEDLLDQTSQSTMLNANYDIGDEYAIFSTNHDLNPEITNPIAQINAAIMMLIHLEQYDIANNIENALLKTIESSKATDQDLTAKIINNLGQKPDKFSIANYQKQNFKEQIINKITTNKTLIGFDLSIDFAGDFTLLLEQIRQLESEVFEIKNIYQNSLLLWPLSDLHLMPKLQNCPIILRFIGKDICGKSSSEIINDKKSINQQQILEILEIFSKNSFDFIKFECLYHFDKKPSYWAND